MAYGTTRLPLGDQQTLWRAVIVLETESFVSRLSEVTGEPISHLMRRLPPPVSRKINDSVHRALNKTLDVALYNLDSDLPEPGNTTYKVASTVTGGISGFFGFASLAVELPVTTTLMLRSIAGIARRHGEDLVNPASRLACLGVFALGSNQRDPRAPNIEASYIAVRTFLARTVSQAASTIAETGIAARSAPIVLEMVSAIASRFGLVVSEKFAAGAIPVIGALGAAAVNLAFMNHFQKLAHAHFSIRRLERTHGTPEVLRMYNAYLPFLSRDVNTIRKRG